MVLEPGEEKLFLSPKEPLELRRLVTRSKNLGWKKTGSLHSGSLAAEIEAAETYIRGLIRRKGLAEDFGTRIQRRPTDNRNIFFGINLIYQALDQVRKSEFIFSDLPLLRPNGDFGHCGRYLQ